MMLLPVVLLAGGLGTRVKPYTNTLPKSLLLINGRPFIDYQLRLLKQQNISEVMLLIGYLGECIKQYVGDGAQYGLKVRYFDEGICQKGTAGCIESVVNDLPDNFFVLYGDSYLLINFLIVQQQFFLAKKSALMTIYQNKNEKHINNIAFDGQRITSYDKLHAHKNYSYLDYGLSVFEKKVFSSLSNEPRDLSVYFCNLICSNALSHYISLQPFYEIGSLDGIQQFREYIRGTSEECL